MFSVWDGDMVNSSWSNSDTPASPPFHEKISYQDTPIISKTDGGPGIDHCILTTKMEDTDDRILPQKMMTGTSDIDHRNLISLTHSPHMSSPVVSADVDYRTFPGIPMPPSPPALLMEAVSKPPKDNVESVDMDLSDDDEKPKSNHGGQKHSELLPPPPLPPSMPFNFEQQNVPELTNQWEQTSQQWSSDRSSFNENHWNIDHSEQWKQPNQWEQEQSDLNYTHNQPPPTRPWNLHDPRSQSRVDFRPKWSRGNNWTRSPRHFSPHPRPSGRWNQGPRFGPRNQPW